MQLPCSPQSRKRTYGDKGCGYSLGSEAPACPRPLAVHTLDFLHCISSRTPLLSTGSWKIAREMTAFPFYIAQDSERSQVQDRTTPPLRYELALPSSTLIFPFTCFQHTESPCWQLLRSPSPHTERSDQKTLQMPRKIETCKACMWQHTVALRIQFKSLVLKKHFRSH